MIRVAVMLGSTTHRVELRASERLVDRLDELAIPLPLSCRAGSCATCLVRIPEGVEAFEPPDDDERSTLDLFEVASDERLGCQLRARLVEPSAHDATIVASNPELDGRIFQPAPSQGPTR